MSAACKPTPNTTMKPIAITLGDPAGIGPEIITKAFRDAPQVLQNCFVAGDLATLRRAAQFTSVPGQPAMPVALMASLDQLPSVPPRCIPLLQVTQQLEPIALGRVSSLAGQAAAQCVQWAARAALRGKLAAMVTAPLNKESLAAAGVPFPGHTELLQHEAAQFAGVLTSDLPVRMMLANAELRVVLVSVHLSLRDAMNAVSFDNVLQTLRIAHQSLGVILDRTPCIAVAGLNPHAGEGGLFGREELDIIAPAVAAARSEGIDACGPYAPDTVFMRARDRAGQRSEIDAVVAMYHDQGLIPVKYLGVEQGVNVTLGLQGNTPSPWRLVRTSPDHGTAFDIVGTGTADASSLIAAVAMAKRMVEI